MTHVRAVAAPVARTTEFEKGFLIHQAKRNSSWKPAPRIVDDQCAINNVRDKGPVVITGCGHAGIVNIRRNAQAIAGVASIYAVVGGFHRSGGRFEPIISAPSSVRAELGPKYVAPGHCTGWSAAYQLATQLPEAFIVGSLGSAYHF